MNYLTAKIIIILGKAGIGISLVALAGLLDGNKQSIVTMIIIFLISVIMANLKAIVRVNPPMRRNTRRIVSC